MLTKASIGNLDLGDLSRSVDEALNQMAIDVHERPSVDKPRTITLKISITPKLQETPDGFQNYPEITYELKVSKPANAVTGLRGFIGVDDATGEVQLMVNQHMPDCEDDPRQTHIFDLTQRKGTA